MTRKFLSFTALSFKYHVSRSKLREAWLNGLLPEPDLRTPGWRIPMWKPDTVEPVLRELQLIKE